MIIKLDTDTLRELTNCARSAADAVDQARSLMEQTVTHEDWACTERDLINEYITKSQYNVRDLQTCADSLYRAIAECLSQFETAQEQTAAAFGDVDGEIASMLSLTPGVVGGGAGLSSGLLSGLSLSAGGLGSVLKDSIDICAFDTIAGAVSQ